MTVPTINLNDGMAMPQLGFGVFQIPAPETADLVLTAIETGYRSIDTAAIYGNEEGVGQAITRTDVPRDDLFVTTKVWNDDQGYDATVKACRNSLDRLNLDFVDLYLIHWPAPGQDRYVDTWKALIALRDDGLVRSIGVSNFEPEHLQRLNDETGELPAINQVELHPWLQQNALREYSDEHGIVLEAWAPLAKSRLLEEPVIVGIADRLGRTPAQVVLRWHLQSGHVAIPKTVRRARMQENFDVFGFQLNAADMDEIAALDKGHRTGPHPNEFGA
ncbi:aldo/keto reductase [Phytoactinopolyspora mesophila]|uniref:Aldo/keto reductase n=1 Tax=Phytoactinopolyspora mesophila TaxID=2650750 RepID=A0A7K3M0Z4_9ACTN|nr:aldo/keto reductase [Phytoactinopolyspora mesophila]NDL56966.1 aldo/keto reductase [Phytoactinopolyspora mesophila]